MLRPADSTEGRREGRGTAVIAALFACISLLAGLDLLSDMGEGASLRHTITEAALLLTGLAGLAAMLRRLARATRQAKALRDEAQSLTERLDEKTAEAERWRDEARSLLEGLGSAIDRQFSRWGLTPAEKEVGLLLLKGLSHKEIADVRGIGEATTRQQARAVYKKAGLAGRHDLSAFFLEDLLIPTRDAAQAMGGSHGSHD
jgi:DNA-binding CsgD family transcriptional regulator